METRRARATPFAPWRLWGLLIGLIIVAGCSAGSTGQVSQLKKTDSTGRVLGRIFDLKTGQDLQGAFVSLDSGRSSLQTLSGPDGTYLFTEVGAGNYRLLVDANGYGSSSQDLLLGPRVALAVDVGLKPSTTTGSLAGTVLDAVSGAPLGSAVLSIPAKNFTTFTDLGGRFSATGLDAGLLEVQVQAVGHSPFAALVNVPAGGAALQTFQLAPNAGSIAGLVLSTNPVAAPQPLAGVQVKLLTSTHLTGRSIDFTPLSSHTQSFAQTGVVTQTGADGTYRLDNVTAGLAGLLFEAPSHDQLLVTTSVLQGRTTELDINLRFNRASMRGRVVDLSGLPVAGAIVSVPEDAITTPANSAGFYDLTNQIIVRDFPRAVTIQGTVVLLPAHETAVGCQAVGFQTDSALVPFVSGGTVLQDFVMGRATGNLLGTVVAARGGQPVSGASVSLPLLNLTTPTAAGGTFAFTGLPAGQYAVNVTAVGFLEATTFAAIVQNETTFTQVRLLTPGAVKGTVRKLTNGLPIAGAQVTIPSLSRATLSDNAGGYTLSDLVSGTYQLDVTAAVETPVVTTAVVVQGQVTTLDVTMNP